VELAITGGVVLLVLWLVLYPTGWLGWATIDTLNSVFHGQQPQESGIGWQLIDLQHNLPAAGKGWEPAVDYVAAYKKAWGVTP